MTNHDVILSIAVIGVILLILCLALRRSSLSQRATKGGVNRNEVHVTIKLR